MREEDAPYETGNQDGVRVWFDHEKLDVYRNALDFVGWCAEMERNGRIVRWAQTALDKTSTGIALNIAEGNGKFSMKDRCRFIGYARTAALQAAATLDVLTARDSALELNVVEGKTLLVDAVRMLVAWQKSLSRSRSG